MCGRYVSRADKQRIAETFDAGIPEDYDPDFVPDYNVAPQTMQTVVRVNSDTGQRELVRMRWGFVPFWAKDTKIAYSTINARAETLTTSSIYREAVKRRRCLVPVDAFYEWQKIDAKNKQPYAIAMKDERLFAFAGLWDRWKDKQSGNWLDTYTIITTDPNELMEPFHDRMPAILAPSDYQRWLGLAEPPHLPIDLLRPFPAKEMKTWKVRKAVGNVRNNSPELLKPCEADLPETLSLFPG
jgi:putative SOS response-associated peptidase YedK